MHRVALGFGVVIVGLFWNGEFWPTAGTGFVTTAEARAGRPATPVSYAGVARRSTVGAGAPGVGVAPVSEPAGSVDPHPVSAHSLEWGRVKLASV